MPLFNLTCGQILSSKFMLAETFVPSIPTARKSSCSDLVV